MRLIRRILTLILFFFAGHVAKAQIAVAGDIAFSGYISDGTDQFSFVLLKSCTAGTVIHFTNNGWLGAPTNAFRSGEETVDWTCPAGGMNAGTEITITGLTATRVGAGAAGTVTGSVGGLNLSTSGDQVLAYVGTAGSPTFLSAIHMNVYTTASPNLDPCSTTAAAWDNTCANTTLGSALPPGLTTGVNCIWIGTQDVASSEADNARFDCAAAGIDLTTLAGARAALNDQTKWSPKTNFPNPVGFTLPTGCNYLGAVCPTITVTNPGITTGTAGTAFSQSFLQTGGATPVTFSTASTLPAGLTLSTAGVLSGTPTQGGTFPIVVTVTDNNLCTGTGSTYNMVINCPVTPTPTITPGGPTTFCAGGSVTLTSSSATNNQWYLNGNPIGGATSQTYSATASGNYTVIVAAAGLTNCFSSPSSATTVTVNPIPPTPTITPGGPTTFCAGGSVTLTSSSAFGNQWYLNGNPIGGETNQTYVATASGNYSVVVSVSGCSSPASAATTVTVNPIPSTPTITPGGPTTFCTGGSVTLTSSSASGNQWYLNGNPIGGATGQIYIATAGGGYSVIVTTSGCSSPASATTTVTVNPIPATPTITPGGPTTFCNGGSVTLTSSSATGNQWYLNGNPIGAATNQNYVATAGGGYTVIVTSLGCSSATSATTTVTVNPIPSTATITPGGPTTFCMGGSVTLTSSAASGNQWYLNGNPIGGATSQTYIATASGGYTVIVTASGCSSASSATTTVTVNPIPPTPTITSSGSTTICAGSAVTLTSSAATGNQWYLNGNPIGGATSQTYPATATGNYTVIVTVSGCSSPSSAITAVTVNPVPDVNQPADQTACNNGPTTAVNFSGTVAGTTYLWTNTNTSIGLAAVGGGNIPSFTATNATNAPIAGTITVTPNYFTGPVNTIPMGAQSSTFPGNTRGYVFTAPADFVITKLFVPTDASSGNQDIAVVKFNGNVPPPTFSATTNAFTTLFLVQNHAASGSIPVSIQIHAGEVIGILGDRGNINSYANGNFVTNIMGTPVTLVRMGMQYQLSNTPPQNLWQENGGFISRVSFDYVTNVCVGTPKTFNINVNPSATVDAVAHQTVCNNATTTAVTFSSSATTGGSIVYNWVNNTPSIGLAANGSGNIPSFTASNLTNSPVIATITVTPAYTNGGTTCNGTPMSFTITVNPKPNVNAVANQVVCNGASTTTVTFSGSTGNTVYDWVNNTPSIGLVGSGTGNILSFTATNTTSAPVVATITVTPNFTGGASACPGDPINFTITVNPTPTGSALPQTICSGGTTSVTLNSSTPAAGTTYSYSAAIQTAPTGGTLSGQGSGTANPITQTLTNNGTTAGVIRYTVTPTYTNAGQSCTGTSFTVDVTVNPTPAGSATAQTICSGGTTSVTLNSTTPAAGTSYSYTAAIQTAPTGGSITGQAGGTANPIAQTLVNTGTTAAVIRYTVTPTYTNAGQACAGTSFTVDVTVNPTPAGSATAQTICNGGTTSVALNSNTPAAGTTYSYTAAIQTAPTGGTITGQAAGSANPIAQTLVNTGTTAAVIRYTVTPTYTNAGQACAGASFTVDVTVNPTPAGSATAQTICSGGTTSVTLNSTTPAAGTTYAYTAAIQTAPTGGTITGQAAGSANPIAQTLVNTGTSPAVIRYTVIPTYTNAGQSCAGPSFTVDVTINPVATVTAVPNQVVCNNSATTAVNFTSPTTGGTIVYNWTNNTTSIGLAASGTGNIASFTATNATTAPVTATITVTPSYTNGAVTCTGTPRTFTITVNPTATVTAVPNQVVCNNSPTTAVTFTSPTTGGTIVYNWTNNTTSIGLAASGSGNIASFTATNTTTAPVTATITVTPSYTNGAVTCVGTASTFTITVNPTATVTAVPNQVVCNNSPTTAVTFTSPTTGGTIVYNWTNNTTSIGLAASGSGNIASFTATNTTTAPVTATITVTPSYTNGAVTCTGTPRTFTITVNPTATVNTVSNQTVCHNSPTTAITFTSPTTGGTIVYNWVNNTPSIGLAASGTGNIPSFTAINTGAAAVTATITVTPSYTNGAVTCTGTPITFTITVNTLSSAPTGATTSSPILCGPGTVTLSAVGGFLGTGASYKWYSGSCGGTLVGTGPVLNNVFVFSTTTYFVRIEGICNTTTCASVTVTVAPQPAVVITAVQSGNNLPPQTIYATVSPAGAYTYVWRRDGVIIPNNSDTLHIGGYPSASYTVTVTSVTSGCTAISNTIIILDKPSTVLYVSPNPNDGRFHVSYYATPQEMGSTRKLMIYDSKGARIFDRSYVVTLPYNIMDVDLRGIQARGIYFISLIDGSGKIIASSKVMIHK